MLPLVYPFQNMLHIIVFDKYFLLLIHKTVVIMAQC